MRSIGVGVAGTDGDGASWTTTGSVDFTVDFRKGGVDGRGDWSGVDTNSGG